MRVLSYPDLKAQKGIVWSRNYVYRLINEGKFPHPIKLNGNTVVWVETEIDRWLARHIAKRDSADTPLDAA